MLKIVFHPVSVQVHNPKPPSQWYTNLIGTLVGAVLENDVFLSNVFLQEFISDHIFFNVIYAFNNTFDNF